jgi:hypothetical protein
MPKDEEVLVVPAALLDQLGPFSGFLTAIDRYLPRYAGPIPPVLPPSQPGRNRPVFQAIDSLRHPRMQ